MSRSKEVGGYAVGDRVAIKPEWRDAGDELLEWVVVGAEEKGRVDIQAQLGMRFNPIQTVRTEMIEPA